MTTKSNIQKKQWYRGVHLFTLHFSLFTLLFFSSCDVTDPIYDSVHPTTCELTLVTDWSNCSSTPASYTAVVGTFTGTCTATTAKYPDLLSPGAYSIYVYNTAEKIKVTGTTATVATVATNVVDPMPGLFCSATQDFVAVQGKDQTVTIAMQQQVRQLTLTLSPQGSTANQIEAIDATLSGVAAAWDFDTNQPTGTPAVVKPVFTKQGNQWVTVVYLLGVVGSEQVLSTTITFAEGIPAPLSTTSNLSAALATFNTNKHEPLALTASILDVPSSPQFECTISHWNVVSGGDVIAD